MWAKIQAWYNVRRVVIGQERRELYPEFKETDLEVLRPFVPQPDLLESPLLEEELEIFQRDLFHLLNQPETCQQIIEIREARRQICDLEKQWRKKEEDLRSKFLDKKQTQEELMAQVSETRKVQQARPTIIKEDKDEPVGDALGWSLVAVAQHWPVTRAPLDSLGLIAYDSSHQEILPYKMRSLSRKLEAINQKLEELEKEKDETQGKYKQELVSKSEEKEGLEKPVLEKLTTWVAEDRDRVIIQILSHPDEAEKWTSVYLQRAIENPAQEEILSYLSWAIQVYGAINDKEKPRSPFSKWALLCFKEKSPEEVSELLLPGKSQNFEEEVAHSFDHFTRGLKHPYLKSDFSQFLKWWLYSELEFYGLPIEEKKPLPYFIPEAPPKRKLKEEPRKEEIIRAPEVAEESLFVLIANQEKPLNQEKLEEYLMNALAPQPISPENISPLSTRIIQTAKQINQESFSPHFKIIKGQSTRRELGAMGRINWRRWRVLANIVSQDGTSLELVGALHRDWGYEGGRVIFFS